MVNSFCPILPPCDEGDELSNLAPGDTAEPPCIAEPQPPLSMLHFHGEQMGRHKSSSVSGNGLEVLGTEV